MNTYFKYMPYLFLIVAVLFVVEGISKYNEGADVLPYIILAVAAVGFFFIRRKSYKRFERKN